MPKRGIMHPKATATSRARYEAAVAADWRFFNLFRFLRASRSYLIAHRLHEGQLLAALEPKGAHFSAIKAVYTDLQSVYGRSFASWWDDRGQYMFGVAVEPEIEIFAHLALYDDPDGDVLAGILDRISEYLIWERPSLASPPVALMAVPLVPNRGAMLRALNDLLTDAFEAVSKSGKLSRWTMETNRIRQSTVEATWETLCHWAAFPDDQLWRVHHRASLYRRKKRAKGKVDDRLPPVDDREDMASSTSRVLRRAYLLAENAARGRFPSFKRLPSDSIDFVAWRRELAASLTDEINALRRGDSLPT